MEEKRGRHRFNKSIGMSVLPPLQQVPLFTQTESASLAEAQRSIESLQKENEKLREQLHDVSSLYKQLVMENEYENFSERRVNLLKSQNIQLKRQILILTEAIGSRANVQLEVENALGTIADHCRTYLAARDRLGEVSVRLSDLKLLVETAESARIKLYKNIENTATQNLQRPLMLMDHFVRHHPDKPVTMMDICSGHLEHLNLKDIAKLESKLAELCKQMIAVNQSLQMIVSPDKGLANHELPLALYARLWGQVSKTCSMLKESSGELLELSVLVPAAPWPLLHRPMLKDLTVDAVMERLPNFHRSKVNDARETIQALLRAMAYTTRTKHAENNLLKEEVDFHCAVYQLQLDYVQTFFNALREGYKTFEQDTNKLLCEPLKAILDAYGILQRTAAEDALRNFLTVFKLNVTQVSEAVEKLAPKDNKDRDEALSDFGHHFFQSIDQLRAESQGKRDDLIGDLDDAKTRQQEAMEHITEFVCSGTTKDDQGHFNKIKSSDRSDKSVIEITTAKSYDSGGKSVIEITTSTTHHEKKESGFTRERIEHETPSGQVGEQLVYDGENDVIESPTMAASASRGDGDTPRARKKWIEPTGRPLSAALGTTSPLLTSRAKRRSVPREGIAQPKLVLLRPKPADGTTADRKGKQPIADLDNAVTEDDTGRPQSRSRSVNRSPNEFSKRSHWK